MSALLDGEIDRWPGLPDATEADLLAAYPSATVAAGRLLQQPAVAHVVQASDSAPFGVRMWAQQGVVTLAEVREPLVTDEALAALGEAEAVLESGLGGPLDQLVWASRGLILHRSRSDGRVAMLYGHEPATVEQVRASPLARIRIERHLL